jgi:DNA-directed RNA polymerase subunit M/transcription elongation factor TFIIS
MFFCEKCHYLYNVAKDIRSRQVGGRVNNALNRLFEKFQLNEPFQEEDLQGLRSADLLNDERFENLNKKDQKKMMVLIKNVSKYFFQDDPEEEIGSNVAYFVCKFCRNYRKIEPGTIIYARYYGTARSDDLEDYSYAANDPSLARTRLYICPNPECPTHKNPNLREAALTKNDREQIIYICTVCQFYWSAS